jgi:hypothetical protein
MPKLRFCLFPVPVIALLLTPAGCNRSRPKADATIEEGPLLLTMLQVGDPKAAAQLVKGWHDVEQGSWRWTMGKFSVTLSPPPQAPQKGAKLVLRLVVPDAVPKKLGAIKLTASVDGVALPDETYAKPGQYVFSRDVAAQALGKRVVSVDFALDKFLPPGDADQRELGLVVTAVGFEAK